MSQQHDINHGLTEEELELYPLTVPVGKCKCGCGGDVGVNTVNRPNRGIIKGEFKSFINGHQQRHPLRIIHSKYKCYLCKKIKDLDQFHIYTVKTKNGTREKHQSHCKECVTFKRRLDRYGINREDYMNLLTMQRFCCAICEVPFELPEGEITSRDVHLDHDHQTGEVRELLCASCNLHLGRVECNPEVFSKVLNYMQKHESQALESVLTNFESYN